MSHDIELTKSPTLPQFSPFPKRLSPLYSTGQRKNYGFITFETEEALMRAVSLCFCGGRERESSKKKRVKASVVVVIETPRCVCLRRPGRARLPVSVSQLSVSFPRRCTRVTSELRPGRAKRGNWERKRGREHAAKWCWMSIREGDMGGRPPPRAKKNPCQRGTAAVAERKKDKQHLPHFFSLTKIPRTPQLPTHQPARVRLRAPHRRQEVQGQLRRPSPRRRGVLATSWKRRSWRRRSCWRK